jgi:hypothetical protein
MLWIGLLLLLTAAHAVHAGEYRFMCLGEVTGLCDVVSDKQGKRTMIKLDFANPESAALFLALQKARIYGTKGVEVHMGVRWEQGIYLEGEFTSGIKLSKGESGWSVPSEPYRDFRVTNVKLAFPVMRFRDAGDDPVCAPVFMEIHFDFESLFPDGLKVEGKPVDFRKHVR